MIADDIYIAGPMRGIAEFNFPAFDDAAHELRVHGHNVFSPAERDRDTGFNPDGLTGHEDLSDMGFDLRDALAKDTEWICMHATAMHMLPGWSNSKGATAERALAIALDLRIEGAPA